MPVVFRPIVIARMSLVLASATMIGAAPASGTLLVDVENVRNSAGLIHVDVCPQARFLKEGCPYSSEVPAHVGMTEVPVRGLPAGRFAVQATHDENGNHRVDRGVFGIPKEGIGFSRDARIAFGPPRWDDAVIDFDGHADRAALHLRYFLGPSGPTTR